MAAMVAAASMVATGLVTGVTPASAATAAKTTDYLATTANSQQRWQSIPGSRIVFNPSQATYADDLPLSIGYFGNDAAKTLKPALKTYRTASTAPAPVAANRALAWSTAFESTSGWTVGAGESATATGGLVRTTLDGSQPWVKMSRTISGIDVSTFHYLTLDVAALGGTANWAISVWASGKEFIPVTAPDGLRPTTADATQAGVAEFDLYNSLQKSGSATFPTSGTLDLTIDLWTTDSTNKSGSVDWRSLQLHDDAAQPWTGHDVGATEEFADVSGWTAAGSSIGIASDGAQATLSLGGTDYSNVSKSFTVDVSADPLLSITVPETSGKWSLKVNDTSDAGKDIELQHDSSATGTFTYNLKDATGWSGSKTFRVVLYQIGANTYSVFDQFRIHAGAAGPQWLSTATSRVNTWRPESLEVKATYSDGSVDVKDVFHDTNSFSRSFTSTLTDGGVAIMGPKAGATWDATSRTLTATGDNYVIAYAVPTGVPDPVTYSGNVYITFPAGVSSGAVGVGMAVTSTTVNADPAAAARTSAIAALADPAADLSHQAEFWNTFLAGVPVAQDYSIQSVATGGVSSGDVEYDYYRAFVDLEMDLLPATPETGNDYPILATGKPSLWSGGAPGARFAAQWDSLVGMQLLAYVDPDNAWASFTGLMAGVQATGAAPADGGDRGILQGESLPSRKAQTAWILYSATGDRDALSEVYGEVKLNLDWERYNLRWIYGSNNYPGELDSEFVSSLAFDLKFAARIAATLGNTEDVAHWNSMIDDLTAIYEQSFFPNTADANGKVWDTVQSSFPSYNTSRGTPWQDENGRWVAAGDPLFSHPGFVLGGLAGDKMARVMSRFLSMYDPGKQLAGLNLTKGPDVQLTTYGLLDMDPGQLAGTGQAKTEAQLRQYADVVVNSTLRDTVKASEFAEALEANGNIGDPVKANGVIPSLFSLSNFIDFVWIANGFRLDEGNRAFVHLSNRQGGIEGLSYLGKPMSVGIDGDTISVSGDSIGTHTLTAAEGQTVRLATADTTELSASVAQATALVESDFTTSSWNGSGVDAALAAAQVLLAENTAAQPEVDAANSALQTAIAALVRVGDPAVLSAVIQAAASLSDKLSAFTDDSAQALVAALAEARDTYAARADRSQVELDAAVSSLQSAIAGLTLRPAAPDTVDKAVLSELYAAAGKLSPNRDSYTSDSWAELQAALTGAVEVLDDSAATQSEVDGAAVRLGQALASLVPAGNATSTEVAALRVNQTRVSLVKGHRITLVPGVYYAGGSSASYSGDVTWKSSKPRVVTVSADGRIKARRTGSATVTVTTTQRDATGRKLSVRILVKVHKRMAKVTKVTANVPKELNVGNVAYLTGRYLPARATGAKVTYSSTNPGVLEVDQVGRILARAEGTAKVVVRAGGKSARYTIVVR